MRLVRLAPLVLALGCESVIGADFDAHPAEEGGQDAQAGTSGQGGAGKGGGGQAGHGASGQTGQGGSGQGGAGQGPGGASPTCPPSSFSGLPSCQQTAASECVACVCNDVNPQTLCAIAYKECLDDLGCTNTVECLLRACSMASCAPLAGASAAKVQKVIPCLTDTCGSTCKPLMSGI